eukprot:453983_1
MADTEARDIQLTLSTIKGSKAFDQNENIDNTNANYHMQTLQTLKHNNTQNDNDDEWSRSYDINNTETEEDNNTETEEEEKELVAIYNQVLAQDSIDTPLASSIPSVNHKISKAKSCTDAKDINETKTNTSSKQISTETTCLGAIMMDSDDSNNDTKYDDTFSYSAFIENDFFIKHRSKWVKLFINPIFCGRTCGLILTLILLILSTAYCVGQLVTVKLELVKKCESKTIEQIWKHSYESSLKIKNQPINSESQFGHTDDPCWTTNTIDTNTEQLWYSNKYIYEWNEFDANITVKSVLFGIIALCCL